jgi:Mn2+/Fe2+ NRAMP family transporter
MPEPSQKSAGVHGFFAALGPGLAMAAFGIGAGDTTTTALGGARYGLLLLGVPLFAAILKFTLNEGLARWQLATGETILEGWALRMGPIVRYGFLLYFLGWCIPAFGTLITTSGLTTDLVLPLAERWPNLDSPVFVGGPRQATVLWSGVCLVGCFALVWFGRYALFEQVMSVMALAMVLITIASAVILWPAQDRFVLWGQGGLPEGVFTIGMAVLGGMGPTVGVMAYSYWMRERGREGRKSLSLTRIDLVNSYFVTALFGASMILLAGGISKEDAAAALQLPGGGAVENLNLEQVFRLVRHRLTHSAVLPEWAGPGVGLLFGVSLWATVVSSLLGLLQSMPYLCADYLSLLTGVSTQRRVEMLHQQSKTYRVFLILLALAPLPLVVWKRPTVIVIIYAVWGSLFMPFLSATLLYMNNRPDWVGDLKNRFWSNVLLLLCLLVFGAALLHALTSPEARKFTA